MAVASTVINAGEESDYTFSFKISQNLNSTHKIWIEFPNNYDAFVGNAQNTFKMCYPDQYLIKCKSSLFNSTVCIVDHWTVVVTGLADVSLGTAIDITVQNVRNPVKINAGPSIKLVVLDSTDLVIGIAEAFGNVNIDDPPGLAVYKATIPISNEIGAASEFSLDFYLDATINQNHQIKAVFPD